VKGRCILCVPDDPPEFKCINYDSYPTSNPIDSNASVDTTSGRSEVLGIKIERLEGGLRGHSERRDDERRRKALGCNPLRYVKKKASAWGMSATISVTTMQLCTAVQLSCKYRHGSEISTMQELDVHT
jgi:hypothetical protein